MIDSPRISRPHYWAALACASAALLSVPPVHAFGSTKPPETAAEIANNKKLAARALAEKQKALREEQELQQEQGNDDGPSDTPVAGPSIAGAKGKTEVPQSGTVTLKERFQDVIDAAPVATAPSASDSEARFRSAAMAARMNIVPPAAASAAGLLRGAGGEWVYGKVMREGSAHTGATSVSADFDSPEIPQRYAFAQRTGEYARYALIGFLSLTYLYAARAKARLARTPGRRITRISEETPIMKMKQYIRTRGIFGLFKDKELAGDPAAEAARAVIVAHDAETLQDYAINLLFARGRHDLSGVAEMLTPNLTRALTNYFKANEAKGHWNKVDRVSNVKCTQIECWTDGGTSYARMLVSWRALDYVVNFNKRAGEDGYIVEGNVSRLDAFQEEWTVRRTIGEAWQVDLMCPVSLAMAA